MGHPSRFVSQALVLMAAAWLPAAGSQALGQVQPGAASVQNPAPLQPASLLDQPATSASVDLSQGELTIHATNSSLRAILEQVGTETGAKIDGLSKDERVFGVYGPGNPQQVLAELLDGTGYNVVIAGRKADGAPRQVTLSLQTARDTTPQPVGTTQAAQEDNDDDAPVGSPFGSFAPEQQQPVAPEHPAAELPQQVRTPQQMLEELQKMRDRAAAQSNLQ